MNASRIESILRDRLVIHHLEIADESHLHAHHAGRSSAPADSGHYNLTIVSSDFAGKTTLQQHRMVYEALQTEMGTTIHALAIKAYLPEQWQVD